MEIKDWTGSVIDQAMLEKAVGKFLRTHRGGGRRLLDWMDSVPSDRTEEQCRAEREAADTAHKVTVARSIAKVNAERAAAGLPPLGPNGDAP